MSTPHAAAAGLQLVVVTGLSGAGRSTAAKCLEDLGWFVVDNLPPSLLPTMVDLGSRSQGAVGRIAVVVDVRSRAFSSDLRTALDDISRLGLRPRVLFLEAADDALVRRFESVRRPHPLQGDGRLVDGIVREKELLRDLRGSADLVLDSTSLNVHELRGKVTAAFGDSTDGPDLHLTVLSFGFKYGLPVDADLVADVRFLPNPHWIPSCARTRAATRRCATTSWRRTGPGSSSTATRACCAWCSTGTPARASGTPSRRSAAPAASTAAWR
jgi:UPF0042 nucleotide-binding protein